MFHFVSEGLKSVSGDFRGITRYLTKFQRRCQMLQIVIPGVPERFRGVSRHFIAIASIEDSGMRCCQKF